uniref:NADH-ubiquinone oxidoreductase chain 4L n=1 Tax=Magicicada cassinii TaxID=38086 RepID=A0A482DQJ3_9HEMI|nr:NADH dehydrogenase subunit 4l [Magicicada cassinii]QBM08883.1 NADH dehydrogenase subunit 4l [Magicicada cassinii]
MSLSLTLLYLIMFMSGIISLCLNRKHIMMSLLSLELMILSLFCMFSAFLSIELNDMYMLMVLLTFSVCEGVVGLSSLINLIRSHGNDQLLSMSLKTC